MLQKAISTQLFIVLSLLSQQTYARKITVKNNCNFKVWPALFTDPNVNPPNSVAHKTGWEAAPGSSEDVEVPDNWVAGRIWGRSDCDFGSNQGAAACKTGGCNGGLECDKTSGTGVPPATLAEFTFGGFAGLDNYDVSLVDGFNLPMSIKSSAGCQEASCPADLNPECPSELKVDGGCRSDCELVKVQGKNENSAICCTGEFATPDKCPASGIPNYDYFKKKCVNSYVFAYDEPSGTAIWTCPGEKKSDYTIIFCP